jgi:hypothetical protein
MVFLLIFNILSVAIITAKANPVPMQPLLYFGRELILMYLGLIIFTLILESLAFLILTERSILNKTYLIKFVILFNLITFPVTQWLGVAFFLFSAYYVYSSIFYFILFYFIIESVPICIEYALFRSILNDFSRDLQVIKPISSKKILCYVLIANLTTFFIGQLIPPFSIIHILS